MIYLCTPYGHEDPKVIQERIDLTIKLSNHLISKGITAISLAVYGHVLVQACGSPSDWGYWQKAGHDMIDVSKELWIIKMDGWKESSGIKGEVERGLTKGKDVKSYTPEEILAM